MVVKIISGGSGRVIKGGEHAIYNCEKPRQPESGEGVALHHLVVVSKQPRQMLSEIYRGIERIAGRVSLNSVREAEGRVEGGDYWWGLRSFEAMVNSSTVTDVLRRLKVQAVTDSRLVEVGCFNMGLNVNMEKAVAQYFSK